MNLKTFFRSYYERVLLVLIFVLALGLRLWAIDFGLPYVGYHSDEPAIGDGGIEILRQEQFNFSKWRIGRAHMYLQAIVGKMVFILQETSAEDVPTYAELRRIQEIHTEIGIPYPVPAYYYWGRFLGALLGSASVVGIYVIGKEIRSPNVGLVSAFLLGINSFHVEQSHYLTRTASGLFFLLLAFYAILRAYARHSWQTYLLALPLIFLAISMKQNNLILLAPLFLALGMSFWQETQLQPFLSLLKKIGLVSCVIASILSLAWLSAGFNTLIYVEYVLKRIFHNTYVLEGTHFGFSGQNTVWWIVDQIFLGPRAAWRLVAFLAIPGFVIALWLKSKGWLVLSVICPYLLMMSQFTVRFSHWLTPVVAMLAILAALTFDVIYEVLTRYTNFNQSLVKFVFISVILIVPTASLRRAITLNYYASQPDVRQVAGEWMSDNLPPNSSVVVDLWGPYIERNRGLEVTYIGSIGQRTIQNYRDMGVDYLVLNSFNLSRIFSAQADPRTRKDAALQIERLRKITEMLPQEKNFTGPALFSPPVVDVTIYRVQ